MNGNIVAVVLPDLDPVHQLGNYQMLSDELLRRNFELNRIALFVHRTSSKNIRRSGNWNTCKVR